MAIGYLFPIPQKLGCIHSEIGAGANVALNSPSDIGRRKILARMLSEPEDLY